MSSYDIGMGFNMKQKDIKPTDDYPWDCDCESCVRKQKMILMERLDEENVIK